MKSITITFTEAVFEKIFAANKRSFTGFMPDGETPQSEEEHLSEILKKTLVDNAYQMEISSASRAAAEMAKTELDILFNKL